MLPIYKFDDKYVADTDGFTFNLAAWLGDGDALAQTPTATVTPSDATLAGIEVAGSLVTIWISGGTASTTYTLEIEAKTTGGRDCRIRGIFGVEA
jgi:hypothetical protein